MARYGFDVSQWDEDMQDALEIIAEVARNEETITYSEFAEELGRYSSWNVGKLLLNPILFATRGVAGCLITSVVVSDKNRPPHSDDHFISTAKDLGFRAEDPEHFWSEQVRKTYEYFRDVRV